MGMDLIGRKGMQSYNWTGWRWLYDHLVGWGVDVRELKFSNDGDMISDKTCKLIAHALEMHREELLVEVELEKETNAFLTSLPKDVQAILKSQTATTSEWIDHQILFWRECNGCSQL